MSKEYDDFKRETINSNNIINKSKDMRAVSEEFAKGFEAAMWEAREIYMRLEDNRDREKENQENSKGVKK